MFNILKLERVIRYISTQWYKGGQFGIFQLTEKQREKKLHISAPSYYVKSVITCEFGLLLRRKTVGTSGLTVSTHCRPRGSLQLGQPGRANLSGQKWPQGPVGREVTDHGKAESFGQKTSRKQSRNGVPNIFFLMEFQIRTPYFAVPASARGYFSLTRSHANADSHWWSP